MEKVENKGENFIDEINKSKIDLLGLKQELKKYKLLKNSLNVAFAASLINYFYSHYIATGREYISFALFAVIILSKLGVDNVIDEKEGIIAQTELQIKTLKMM